MKLLYKQFLLLWHKAMLIKRYQFNITCLETIPSLLFSSLPIFVRKYAQIYKKKMMYSLCLRLTVWLNWFSWLISYFIVAPCLDAFSSIWYYCFKRSFWCNKPTSLAISNDEPSLANKDLQMEEFSEMYGESMKHESLSKILGTQQAVKIINLQMYEGHIIVLLSHNDVGKSTIMSMITALIEPTSGTAFVNGYAVRKDTEKIRESMGICTQENIFFNDFTVQNCLHFFCLLFCKKIDKEINEYIKRLDVEEQKNVCPKYLCREMKIKLGVAFVSCGNSKVVMLVEPTTKMDSIVRREVWKILHKQKNDEIIFLTRYTNETYMLMVRIVIMAVNKLQCCGSSFSLERRYGTDYCLMMNVTSNCHPEKKTSFLRKYIPYVQMSRKVGSKLAYHLSNNGSSKYEYILHDPDNNISNLFIRGYGISLATLEEVFLESGIDKTKFKKGNEEMNERKTNEFYCGYLLGENQWKEMFLNFFLSSILPWITTLPEILIPIFLLVVCIEEKK